MTLNEWLGDARIGEREWGFYAEVHPSSSPECFGVYLDLFTPNQKSLWSLDDYEVVGQHGCLVWLSPRRAAYGTVRCPACVLRYGFTVPGCYLCKARGRVSEQVAEKYDSGQHALAV